jgi:N-methylhydantoinase A
MTAAGSPNLRVAADIGGTFTDVAVFDEQSGQLRFAKTLSTPQVLVDGIADGIAKSGTAVSDIGLFLHGSTVAINTMLERTGPRTALLITKGFRDIYEIGRVNRPDSYNLFFQKHEPLVPRSDIYEVTERLYADGEIETPLDEAGVEDLCREIADVGYEGVAILLLHCYANNAHERRVKEIVERYLPDAFVTASYELSQEYREFERCSTVASNAYVGPRVRRYLGEISRRLSDDGFSGSFLVVQSTGGLFEMDQARSECVRMLESGPAAGVIGTRALCALLGLENAIAFDMGGTTAKAGVIYNGDVLTTGSALIGGYDRALPIQIPMMDIFEVGTGGGSIARVSPDGGLRVGPQSAGADPGPVCYGLGGTEPTVTDANLVLGRLDPGHFLGGEMTLNADAATATIDEKVATPLGFDAIKAAEGVLRIAATSMSYAVKGVTTERGLDAGDFTMVAYGGAGPLHASAVAREIGIRRIIVPLEPGTFSAFGMLFSDLRYDAVRTWFTRLAEAPFDRLEAIYGELEDQGRDAVARTSLDPEKIEIARAADMRYVGQEHAVTVDLPLDVFRSKDHDQIKRHFDEVHDVRYGTSAPGEAAEIVSLRSTVTGLMGKPALDRLPTGVAPPETGSITGRRNVYFSEAGGFLETPIYRRDRLLAGNRIEGPALIEEHASTTVVLPGDRLEVDAYGNLVITYVSEAE